ncbi:MAG: hypothetical protein AB7F22_30165 [Reyranella sp.]|uniref:hypothetical protein n=1 Tax=Reyranella sp. TaxID=1929291 RepID=UPI003D0E9961
MSDWTDEKIRDTLDCWRINYGLDKGDPVTAAKWWRERGGPPDGAILALAAAIDIIEQQRRELRLLQGHHHPGYIIGSHWMCNAYRDICAGEPEEQVMRDFGWVREGRK